MKDIPTQNKLAQCSEPLAPGHNLSLAKGMALGYPQPRMLHSPASSGLHLTETLAGGRGGGVLEVAGI